MMCGTSHFLWISLAIFIMVAPARAGEPVDPFDVLRRAYAERDAGLAASAYSEDARLVYEDQTPAQSFRGVSAIKKSFEEFFASVDPSTPLDLNFRIESAVAKGELITERGVYRLKAGRKQKAFGRFETVRDMSPAGLGRWRLDRASSANAADFERIAGPIMFASNEEDLDLDYYGLLTGRYRLPDGCSAIITASVVRLFARDDCNGAWRGLSRKSGNVWTAGDKVVSETPVAIYEFDEDESAAASMLIREANNSVTALRETIYERTAISFVADDGVTLMGDLYLPPANRRNGLATVLLHGSGPQDRNGYASIIAVMADALAADGHVVLTYDKRGVGASDGDWSRASLARLARDAEAGMKRLGSIEGVDRARIGVAGSSQAGWVAAKLVEQGAAPSHVVLLGAAGSALTVVEQNLYNTRVRMACAGVAKKDIRLAIEQQEAFFAYLKSRRSADAVRLDALTKKARARTSLGDWLFPSSAEIDWTAGDWFTTLEVLFDPLPVWRSYKGRARFLFAEHDDSTPTVEAAKRLESVIESSKGRFEVVILKGAQHLGLRAHGLCGEGVGDSQGFAPGFFEALAGL
jgi:pimeloyl-ACP methyl ester carboxylesterase/ketosteroid isomerase-like protein